MRTRSQWIDGIVKIKTHVQWRTLLTGLDDRLKSDDSPQGDTNESENNCFLVFNIF